TILVTLSEFAKQTAQCRDSGSALRPQLTAFTSRFFDGSVAGVKVTCGLPAQMQRTGVSAVVGQCACSTRQGDSALDEGPQLLRLRQSRDDALFPRVDQRGREIAQHRVTMLAGATEFSMCLKVSHDSN